MGFVWVNLEALAFVALSMLALVANSALSFQATGLVSSTGRSGVVMQEKSKAIPFLNAAPALDGTMPGDKGFDPLLLSNTVPAISSRRSRRPTRSTRSASARRALSTAASKRRGTSTVVLVLTSCVQRV